MNVSLKDALRRRCCQLFPAPRMRAPRHLRILVVRSQSHSLDHGQLESNPQTGNPSWERSLDSLRKQAVTLKCPGQGQMSVTAIFHQLSAVFGLRTNTPAGLDCALAGSLKAITESLGHSLISDSPINRIRCRVAQVRVEDAPIPTVAKMF